MLSPLIPERPLMVSPSLATNIGLEPAVLLHILSDILVHRRTFTFGGHQWAEVHTTELLSLAPFWQQQTLIKVLNRLVSLRILKVDPSDINDQTQIRFALLQHDHLSNSGQINSEQPTEQLSQAQEHIMPTHTTMRQPTPPLDADHLASTYNNHTQNSDQYSAPAVPSTEPSFATSHQHEPQGNHNTWQPGQDLVDQISALGVPEDFLLNRVEAFSIYRRESRQQSYSQDAAFRLFIMKEWRKEQTKYRAQPGQKHNLPAFLVDNQAAPPPPSGHSDSISHNLPTPKQALHENRYHNHNTPSINNWQTEPQQHTPQASSNFGTKARPSDTPSFLNQPQPKVIDKDWWPDEDAFKLQEGAGIDRQFLEDAVPEFVLYWRERGVPLTTWNTKFVAYTREQWAKLTAVTAAEKELRPMSSGWYPSDDCFDILCMANIDTEFAKDLIKEFILYWKDNRQVCKSWNTKFLQHVKYHWAKRHQLNPSRGQQGATHKYSNQSTQNIEEQLTDRSWASEFFDETLS